MLTRGQRCIPGVKGARILSISYDFWQRLHKKVGTVRPSLLQPTLKLSASSEFCGHSWREDGRGRLGCRANWDRWSSNLTICCLPTAGDISPPTSPTSAGSVHESESNPAYLTINPPQPASDLTYPPAYPQQKAGYPAMYPSAYPQQPMANSTYPVQPVGAQPFTAVTVVDRLKHVSI